MDNIRKATHADGHWYSNSPKKLTETLKFWLDEVKAGSTPPRAIIAPHAGYYYSAACAAFAYKQIDASVVKRIFIIGPSHHQNFDFCGLTTADKYETPLYDLDVDKGVVDELMATGKFQFLGRKDEEEEHSVEMQLPFIAKVMESYRGQFTIVPILVSSLSYEEGKDYGRTLSRYLLDPTTLFVISSDFCHWGQTYHYTYYDENSLKPIHEFIEELDKMGMELIERLDVEGFYDYLVRFKNTICGRHPILVFLHAVDELVKSQQIQRADLKFLKYAQSHECHTTDDFSVSYAAAAVVISSKSNFAINDE